MNFAPAPANDFPEFIQTYYDRCRAVCPKIQGMAGKWRFEDLIPGLSDFDTRFLVDDGMTVSDWSAMSVAVGKVHGALARERPEWARILEHLPGLNLTFAELVDPVRYYPEFRHWTFYQGDKAKLDEVRNYLGELGWSERDEAFQLKKLAIYYGPYQRGIDPAVNLGQWESKYPLHSRYMHYFTPAVQAAVSLWLRRPVMGKLESLRDARELFPHAHLIDRLFETVERHYEIPGDYEDAALIALESELDDYLKQVYAQLKERVTLIAIDPDDSPAALRDKIKKIPVHPAQRYFDGVRFCRLMKGRLLFYGEEIAWFDTRFLIRNDLGRIVENFYRTPLRVYGEVRFGGALEPAEVLGKLRGDLLAPEECDGFTRFAEMASQPLVDGEEKATARAVANYFEPVLVVTEKLGIDLRSRVSL